MPIIRKDDVAPERPIIIVLYGQPGSGKTSLATTAEKPLIIDCDRGYDRAVQRVDTLCANTWNEVIENIPNFKDYKTIVGDTAKAILDDFLSEYVCQTNYKLRTNTLKRYGQMADEFKSFVGTLRSNGSDLIFICHDKETSEGDTIKHSPDCTGQSKDLLLRIADQVGYISIMNGKRHVSFEPTDNYIGKNVAQIPLMEIPDVTSPDFSGFMAEIIKKVKTSIQSKSEAQRQANELITKLRIELSKVDDDESAAKLLSDCKELPQIMKQPFFQEINTTLTSKGFVFADNKFTKPSDEKKPVSKKTEKKDDTKRADGDK